MTPSNHKRDRRKEKGLHPRNLHRRGYDFSALQESSPALRPFVMCNQHGDESVDYSIPDAVKSLNKAILIHDYAITDWDIPDGCLCPPIPGRVDYIHYVADLLGVGNSAGEGGSSSSSVRLLDIGTGANGIYSLLAIQVYGWQCTASDIDPASLGNVAEVASKNPEIERRLSLRLQTDNSHIFENIILPGEYYDVSVCNPPFHASLEEALKGSQKKLDKLARSRKEEKNESSQRTSSAGSSPTLNFGGQKAELWCKGGEIRFLRKMLKESKRFGQQCRWFTTLISKGENVKPCQKLLRKLGVSESRVIEMTQGNKITRVLVWSFSQS